MEQIELQDICKVFRIAERPQGRFAALRGAFVRQTKVIRALDNISFSISEGDLVGYIGPNGAGKSTTVKIMSGILTPDTGTCRILERIPWQDRVRHVAQIGVVFGQRSQLWWDVPVSDSFELLKDIYNIPVVDYRTRLSELEDTLSLGKLLKTPVRQLSLGQRMRCEIAAALLHRPKVLFLDEPTIGLDAVSKIALREFLKRENRKHGVTMILTTHDMDDVEALCQKVMVIGHGKLLYNGSLAQLKSLYAPLRYIKATADTPIKQCGLNGAETVVAEGNTLTVMFNPTLTPAHTLIQQIASKLTLLDIVIEEQSVDKMVACMYQELNL